MNLAAIGRLGLIKLKFGNVVIPDAVWCEVVIDGKGKRGAFIKRNLQSFCGPTSGQGLSKTDITIGQILNR
jgi:hypothetical protein